MECERQGLNLVSTPHRRAIRGGKLESLADIFHGEQTVSDEVDLGPSVHQDSKGLDSPIGSGHWEVELELEALPRAPHLRDEQM